MEVTCLLYLPLGIFLIATLYSSVGHGGASGYLAVMALFSVSHFTMRPAALILNILVASIAAFHFIRAGYFSVRIFLPFAAASVPAAFIGGIITLGAGYYQVVVGLILLFAAWRLIGSSRRPDTRRARNLPIYLMVIAGLIIGLLSGLTGVGGGIFLSPLLLLFGLCDTKTTSGVTAMFVLVNSISGLLGVMTTLPSLPPEIWIWLLTAGIGGLLGSTFGRRSSPHKIRILLSLVLVVAGLKMILG